MYIKHIIWAKTKHFVWTFKFPNVYFLSFEVRVALEAKVWEKGKGRQGILKKTDLITSPDYGPHSSKTKTIKSETNFGNSILSILCTKYT